MQSKEVSSKFVKKIHQPLRQGKRYHGLERCRLCESRSVCRNWPQERRKYPILWPPGQGRLAQTCINCRRFGWKGRVVRTSSHVRGGPTCTVSRIQEPAIPRRYRFQGPSLRSEPDRQLQYHWLRRKNWVQPAATQPEVFITHKNLSAGYYREIKPVKTSMRFDWNVTVVTCVRNLLHNKTF